MWNLDNINEKFRMRWRVIFAAPIIACAIFYAGMGPAWAINPESDQSSQSEPSPQSTTNTYECKDGHVCKEISTGLPLRILPRSFSNIYKSQEKSSKNIAQSNVRAFSPLYVFARNEIDFSDPTLSKGWYQVSEKEDGPPLGWMQAQDVLEWRQALVVSYTHPGLGGEERQRVLMFRQKENLLSILDSTDLVGKAVDIYERLQKSQIADGLISKEPELFVDINRTFYLLPIVEFDTIDIEGDEARILQLAAAIPRKRGADTLKNSEYRKKSMEKPRARDEAAKELGIDIVFVMDMTMSMQPYIDRTKQAIKEIAQRIAVNEVKEKIRFGLVGYKDKMSKTTEFDFISKNFTPQLVDMEGFIEILKTEAKAAEVSSIGFPEEVFAGIETGLKSNWTEDALRFIILVGDSSSHPVGHQQNTTGKDSAVLRQAAEDDQIHILAIHLENPLHPEDHTLAKPQYSNLSRIRGKEESALVAIDTRDQDTFQAAVGAIAQGFSDILIKVRGGKFDMLEEIDKVLDRQKGDEKAVQTAKYASYEISGAALVEYLGKEADPPKDIVAWVLDRDMTNSAIQTLEVRVLVNKRQLSDLSVALERIIGAIDRAKISQMQFFDALREVSGQTMKNPEEINQSGTLVKSGLLPAFIQSLPYKSEVLSLNNEMYASMTAEQRASLDGSLRAKLQQYRDINEQVDGWIRLNDSDRDMDKVYPLHLDYLP